MGARTKSRAAEKKARAAERKARKLSPPRLGPRDVFHVGSAGLRSRPMRVFLSALGIAIGIATMIAVVGISSSSQAKLLQELDKLGTNMMVATPASRCSRDRTPSCRRTPPA